jgi:ubiquinone/menaquinone biosynthesis C-methylase UbiE
MSTCADYILGTHEEEIQRLALQHAAWRADAIGAWRAAGFGGGQTILDVGCSPGLAALDLAEMVGTVVAIDKSERFLEALSQTPRANIKAFRADLDLGEFPDVQADGAWCRWILSFTRDPGWCWLAWPRRYVPEA